ncbi:MAG TPA: glycosyltransferase [Solirubrobacteraceae bacterium]|nr:glycosyltransferase [Solirubrobacteraceae bacterium]
MRIGGAERIVTMLAAGLVERGHEVILVAPAGERDEDLRGVPHVRLRVDERGRTALGALRAAGRLARILGRLQPDVVHAQNVKYATIARLATTLQPRSRTPLLASFHGVLPAEYRRAALLLRGADHVACVSGAVLERIVAAGLPRTRASLVRNAVELPPPLTPARRAQIERELGVAGTQSVAIVGRLVAQKAHERFVVAARLVADALPDTRFLVVGDGPRRAEIERMVAQAGLSERMRFTGRRSDAREIIALAQVLVFSSEWEGLSIAALEALAAGTPVVSTDVEGMRELLSSGAGAVVPLDDGAALGERLLALLRDQPARLAMGRVGRALIAKDYSLQRMISAYVSLYERLARDGGGARPARARPAP